jgi:hypothetical protein
VVWSGALAAVPSASQLFPQDTFVLVSVSDWPSARTKFQSGSFGRLWDDPSMKVFRDHFEAKFRDEVIGGMEKDLGIKTDDYLPLLQGQLSIGLIENGWNPADEKSEPGLVMVLDTKDKSDQLKTRLAEVRQKLSDAKKTVKTSKVRDLEFTTVVIEPAVKKSRSTEGARPKVGSNVSKPDDDDDDDDDDASKGTGSNGGKRGLSKKAEWTFGQADTALVVGDSLSAVEKIVARLTGGAVPPIGENGEYQTSERDAGFKEALAYGWLNLLTVSKVMHMAAGVAGSSLAPMGMDPNRLISALGFDGIRSAAGSFQVVPEGEFGVFSLAIPESKRIGLFKLLSFEPKDSAPPAYVPADAVSFTRWRINGQQTWAALESLVKEISPQLNGLLQMSMGALGKDQDPAFDFRKVFIGNLGDDLVTYQKPPKSKTLSAIQDPPSLVLVGSVDAPQLAAGFKSLSGILPNGGEDLKERELNGRKVYGLKFPKRDGTSALLEIAPGNGMVAIGSDPALIEEFIRSGDGAGKSLKDVPGLNEAAQKVGGMGTGFFGYQDQREGTRTWWEVMRAGDGLEKSMESIGGESKQAKRVGELLDVKSLPPFDAVAKYFGVAVYAGSWESGGFKARVFWPTPK